MVQWAPSDSTDVPVQAYPCQLNTGVLDSLGVPLPRPVRIYVHDALIAAVGRAAMEMALAATNEAIFNFMGEDNLVIF